MIWGEFQEKIGGERLLLQNILALCKERKISVAKLEKEIGLGNATIGRWGNSSPTVENVRKVADYFGVSIDGLMGRSMLND